MKEQAFYKTINSFMEELQKNTFGVGILYDMCSDKLHPWGNKFRLGDKLYFICKLHNFTLRESFLEYDAQEGGEQYRHRRINEFGAIRDMLSDSGRYKAFVEKISGINRQFAFDGGSEDIALFKESLSAVLEFNEIVKDAICRYDKLYDQKCTRGDNIQFTSVFLHFHRPEQFFMHDNEICAGIVNLRSERGCRIGGAIIDEEAKAQIEATYRKVLNSKYDDVLTDGGLLALEDEYICSMGLQYAICCYIKKNCDSLDGLNGRPFPLVSAEILKHVRRLKSEEEIEEIIEMIKPETPLSVLALYCDDVAEFDQLAEAYMRRNNKTN